MIKAEAIIHEGTPGPNWLDRCRTVTTPTNITYVLLFVVGIALFAGLVHKQQTQSASQQPKTTPTIEQSTAPLVNLEVQPLSTSSTADSSGNADIQSAEGGLSTTSTAQSSNANSLGAAQTPSLNNAHSASAAGNKPTTQSSQNLLNAKSLTNTVQSTIQSLSPSSDITQSTQDALHGLGL